MQSFKTIFIVFLILITGFRCKKKITEPVIEPKEITGKWEWEHTYLYSNSAPVNLLTPRNTGINEIITYNSDRTWSKRQNNILVDTGTYSIGHASRRFDPWSVSQIDSIKYYKNGLPINGRVDYYYIIVDSLNFNPGLGGVGPGDSKWYIRQ